MSSCIIFNFGRYLQILGREENKPYSNEKMKTVQQRTLYVSAKIVDHRKIDYNSFRMRIPEKTMV